MTDLRGRPGDPSAASRPTQPRVPKQEQEPASDEVTEIAPGILRMQLPVWMPGLGHVNMYGLADSEGLAVVDPGLPGPQSWKALKARLRTAGYRTRDVHTVVVTHSHPDHFGAAGRLRKEAGARLITHQAFTTWSLDRRRTTLTTEQAERLERDAIDEAQSYSGPSLEELPELRELDDGVDLDAITAEQQRRSVPWGGTTPWGGSRHPMPPLARRVTIRALRLLFTPPDPTVRVRHGARLTLGGREWFALHTPGHTLDHLCLYDPRNGILLSGDHVLPSITPHVSGSGEGDSLRSYLATLELVASLDGVRLGLPAHGHPFTDVPGRVAAIREHHHDRMEKLRHASLRLGPAGVVELSHAVFPERHWGVMAESETFAHLEHMRRDGDAERWNEGERLVYRVAPAAS